MDFFKEIFVFAGPNGSGKSTVIKQFLDKQMCPPEYICPDDLVPVGKKEDRDEYIKAMKLAESKRVNNIARGESFTFETVLSTEEKVYFLKEAKNKGFKITTIYITTSNPQINLKRVEERKRQGGHGVEPDKVFSRYIKAMKLIPQVIEISDYVRIYDNSSFEPVLIFEKNEVGQLLLMNREKREICADYYLVHPLKRQKIKISKDLSCEETENLQNS